MSLTEQLNAALVAAAPITPERAVEIAEALLPPTEMFQFRKWFSDNGPHLIERINSL